MHRVWRAAVIAAVLGVGSAAGAHEFACLKRVNGQRVASINEYPAMLHFDYRLTNLHPTEPSVATSLEDPVLAGYGWRFKHATPLAVPVGGSAESTFSLSVGSYEECRMLAAKDGLDDGIFDSTFRVVWELGESQCLARLSCELPYTPPPDDCEEYNACPEPLITRDEGFFKNHEAALQQCLDLGPLSLGSLGTVSTLPHALGVLWGSPTLHRGGEPRTELDTARFLLARQLLVGHCNAHLFHALPTYEAFLQEAREALSGTDCPQLEALTSVLRGLNVSGRSLPLPEGFEPGPPTPVHAQRLSHDFTQPGAGSCTAGP